MAEITQTITELPEVTGRYDSDFIETADSLLNKLPAFSNELNNFGWQINEVRDEVNSFKNETILIKDDVNTTYEDIKKTINSAINFAGTWDKDIEYTINQTVEFNKNIYMSLQDNTDKQPDLYTDCWFCLTDFYKKEEINSKIKINSNEFDEIIIEENKNASVIGPIKFNTLVINDNSVFKII